MPEAAPASVKPRVLLIVPFDASALDREEQWVGEGVAQILSLGLAQHPAFVQVERVRLRRNGSPEAWADAPLVRPPPPGGPAARLSGPGTGHPPDPLFRRRFSKARRPRRAP